MTTIRRRKPQSLSVKLFYGACVFVCLILLLVVHTLYPDESSSQPTVSASPPSSMKHHQPDGFVNILAHSTTTSHQIAHDKPKQPPKKQSFSNDTIAYAISITACPVNTTTVLDGPAILKHSIHHNSKRAGPNATSKYDYKLYAFVHPNATKCTDILQSLGYEVLIRDIPIRLDAIQGQDYREAIERDGCCGSKEFLKLWAYSLIDHNIAVHLDTDVFLLQPLDDLFDAIAADDASKLDTMENVSRKHSIDFFYTRDYLQRSRITKDPKRYGVQGGFFVTKPNLEVLHDMQKHLLIGNYRQSVGWGKKLYGGFWGASQIQGFLSYYYGEIRPQHAVELNRCVYNTMVDDDPYNENGSCRTGQQRCQDCRETPLADMKSVHLTTCWKPWHCPTLKSPHPPRCKEVHRAWFDLRQSLELSWGYEVPKDGWWFRRTLGYCTKAGGAKKRYYLPLQLPNVTVDAR